MSYLHNIHVLLCLSTMQVFEKNVFLSASVQPDACREKWPCCAEEAVHALHSGVPGLRGAQTLVRCSSGSVIAAIRLLSHSPLFFSWKVELRKEFQAQETALQRSLSKLRSEVQKAQEEARENRDKTNRLQTSLANAEGTIKVRCTFHQFRYQQSRFCRSEISEEYTFSSRSCV